MGLGQWWGLQELVSRCPGGFVCSELDHLCVSSFPEHVYWLAFLQFIVHTTFASHNTFIPAILLLKVQCVELAYLVSALIRVQCKWCVAYSEVGEYN